MRRMTDTVDPRLRGAKTMFFVIGAQKCGTTWLQQYCQQHPEICVPIWKEQNYWVTVDGRQTISKKLLEYENRHFRTWPGAILNRLPFRRVPKRAAAAKLTLKALRNPGKPHHAYADSLLLAQCDTTRVVGEISPKYGLLSSDVFQQMNRLNDNTRFIYLMRDPAARLVSAIKHGLRKMPDPSVVNGSLLYARVDKAVMDATSTPMQKCAYDKTIAELEAVVARDRILYLFFEDLFKQPTIDAFCNFVGVRHHPAMFEKKVNVDRYKHVKLSDPQFAAVVDQLSHVYETVFTKFGDRVPAAWRASYEKRSLAHA